MYITLKWFAVHNNFCVIQSDVGEKSRWPNTIRMIWLLRRLLGDLEMNILGNWWGLQKRVKEIEWLRLDENGVAKCEGQIEL